MGAKWKSVRNGRTRISIDFPTPEDAMDLWEQWKTMGFFADTENYEVGLVKVDALHTNKQVKNHWLVRSNNMGNGRPVPRREVISGTAWVEAENV